jgi:uncharacterized protein YkwD
MKRVGRPAGSRVTSAVPRVPQSLRAALLVVASIPVLVGVYMQSLRSHARAFRLVVLGIAVLAAGSFAVIRLAPQAQGHRPAPVDVRAIARLATPLVADVAGMQPIDLSFNAPMNRDSVQASLTVTPITGVELTWSAGDTGLAITPLHAWSPGIIYTVSVATTARTASGTALAEPVRAIFLTADAPTATIVPVSMTGKRASASAGFRMTFSRPIDLASLRAALTITPAADGQLSSDLQRGDPTTVTWVPSARLEPNTTYVVTFAAPVVSSDQMAVATAPRLVVRTVNQPEVVRTRPADRAQAVPAGSSVSVRFDRAMTRATTQSAFRLVDAGTGARAGGSFSWAEGDTVLVFTPTNTLAAGHAYTLSIGPGATGADGVGLAIPAGATSVRASFRVAASQAAAKTTPATTAHAASTPVTPTPKPTATPTPAPTPKPSAAPSASAPWLSVEQYALQLLNCTRTGGWVQSNGTCVGYGSGKYSAYVAPLTLSPGISTYVSRPYAKYQAVRNACSHFLDGTPGDRLARAGYTSYRWGENIGCQSGDPRQVVINTMLFFQGEKSYNGGHWANLKSAQYSTVGVGVWDYNGYVLVVFDFYHP